MDELKTKIHFFDSYYLMKISVYQNKDAVIKGIVFQKV